MYHETTLILKNTTTDTFASTIYGKLSHTGINVDNLSLTYCGNIDLKLYR